MQVLKAGDYRRMAWKNGGGQTAEIAVSPPGAGLGDFDWRISMATVARDGPFSSFPGIDRTLTILSGGGIILQGPAADEVTLSRHSAPFSFAADDAVSAVLVDGAIVDLNVMTRRGRMQHRVERRQPPFMLEATSDLCLVFCTGGSAILGSGTSAAQLETFDCAILQAEDLPLPIDGCQDLLLIELDKEKR